MNRRIARVFGLLVAALSLSAGAAAHADSGVVRGRIQFYNNQGNFCPAFRNCTAARYTQAQFNVNRPIRDAKVALVSSTGQTLGLGTTDSAGTFVIQWSSPSSNVRGHIEWYGEHKETRFMLRSANGRRWVMWGSNRNLTNGTTTRSTQWLGTYTWGNATSPHSLANLYDGAQRTWQDWLRASSWMRAVFVGVEIRAYDGTTCPTSCADGAQRRVIIDSAASAFTPQARVMHEMGHIASYLANPYDACVQYWRDGNNAWTLTSAEWACASFEEGLATFLGDRAIYWQASPMPHTCISGSWCPANRNVESSTGIGSCATDEGRWALTTVRYLRDLYDSTDESLDTNTIGFSRFIDTLRRYGSGDGERQDNEPWETVWNSRQGRWVRTVTDFDGRSAVDFKAHIEALTGQVTLTNYLNNCGPVGD